MSETGHETQVAVYIDFDNIVMSRYDELHGRESFRNDGAGRRSRSSFIEQRLKDAHVDIGAIIAFASSFGNVAISRAYANWAAPVNASYSDDLLASSVDLVQMFPVTNSKNGADIRLAIDVIDDISRFGHLTHVVIVAGDSDYMSLAQRCRRLGRTVIGVGAAKSVGKFFRAACDDFRFYGNLPTQVLSPTSVSLSGGALATNQPTVVGEETRTLLVRAATLVASKNEEEWFPASPVKVQMKRLDPSYDETALGFKNFTALLEAVPDILEHRNNERGPRVRLVGKYATTSGGASAPVAPSGPSDAALQVLQAVGLGHTGLGGREAESACVDAIRALWHIMDTAPDGTTFAEVPVADVLAAVAGDAEPTPVVRRSVRWVFQMVPAVLRQLDFTHIPNPEMTDMTDGQLVRVVRETIASRAQHKLYPKTATATAIAEAVFGAEESSRNALNDYRHALGMPTVQAMSETLGQVLVPAPWLWDIAMVVPAISGEVALSTVDALTSALREPLAELDRDVAELPAHETFAALTAANVLRDTGDGLHNTLEDAEPSAVAEAILRDWLNRLRAAGQLRAEEFTWLDSLYRIVLGDRLQTTWRAWVREVLEDVVQTSESGVAQAVPAPAGIT